MKYLFEFRSPNGRIDVVIAETKKKAIDLYCGDSTTKKEFVKKHFTIKNKGRH